MSVHKIFQQRRSSRLAGPMFYDCLVLLYRLAEGPDVAREKKIIVKKKIFLAYNTPRPPMSVQKKCQPIRSSLWPAVGNIYMSILFHYKE